MNNNEELIIQIPVNENEALQIFLNAENTEKYLPKASELKLLESKCVELTNSRDVSLLYLEF